ncbi:MAG: DUF3152 domain-containing protein [Dermatophilaceae bacterium]
MSKPTPGLDVATQPGGEFTRGPASSKPERGSGARSPSVRALAAASLCAAIVGIAGAHVGDDPVNAAPGPGDDGSFATAAAIAAPSPTRGATSGASPTVTVSVPQRGAGTTHVLSVPGQDSERSGRAVRYTVEVEDGAGVDEAEFARTVRDVLTDRRGWEPQDGVHFVNVDPSAAAEGASVWTHITLATPDTVDRLCAPLDTGGQVSCRNGDRVALNAVRWTQGVKSYVDDLAHYRIYMINHEVGHAIGHGHESCPGAGQAAPVMLQQTLGLQGCTKYPWAVPNQSL